MASPMPVLPLVGSTSVPPGFSAPPRSASSTMATAMRSLTLPPGFRDAYFAITVAPPGWGRRLRRTMGVCPMSSRTLAAIGGRPTAGASSDVVHRTGGALALAHAFGQLAEREPVDHARHGLGDLVPQLHQVLTITAAPAITSGFERATGALDGTKDGAHGDRFRRTSQMVTPGGPPFGGERLHHRPALVEPTELSGGLDHGVLPRHRVRRQRHAELALGPRDDVEVRQGRLDHDDVRALVEVERDLAHGLDRIRRIHLVRAPVPELRGRIGGVPEGAVEARRVLCRVRHDRHLDQARLVEGLANRADTSVHHVRRRHHVRARLGLGDGDACDQFERRIVLHGPVLDDAAVTVAGVLAEAHVGDDEQIRHGVLHGADRLLDDAVVGVGFRPAGVLVVGQAEHQHRGDAVARDVLGLSHQLVDGEPELSRHRADRLAHAATVHGEHGIHEVVHAERGLTDEPAEQTLLAQPAGTEHRMWHHSLLLVIRDSTRPCRAPSRAKCSLSARARAGMVYSMGITCVVRPYSAAVAAVIGPMEATTTSANHVCRSSSVNSSAKFRAVEELVNVTASTPPAASASRSRWALASTRFVTYAGTSHTSAPRRMSSLTRTSRVWAPRGRSTRSPLRSTPRRCSTSAAARYSPGRSRGGRR